VFSKLQGKRFNGNIVDFATNINVNCVHVLFKLSTTDDVINSNNTNSNNYNNNNNNNSNNNNN
jgi:hypothetical protein